MYAGIDQIVVTESFRASAVCDVLEVSRSGFYAWRSEEESLRDQDNQQLGPVIAGIFWHHRRRYGARRIAVELSRQGLACGVARVTRLLKTRGLQAIQPKSYQPRSTESRHRLGYNANLLMDRAAPETINEVWVGDITYIPLGTRTREGRFGYLALLMDLYSRRVVGWAYQDAMGEDLVLRTLRRAIHDRQPGRRLVHHTDRGGQYASRQYRDVLRRAGMVQSMSAAGHCYDNAFMESCFGTLKTELELVEYRNGADALRELSSYIAYYNTEWLHSGIGYLSPIEFERQQLVQK
ncbi:MAG: IS3 family transposase [Planctomycetaceae bacterium]|nr:IS3 family transposase [Planctomycetaceae bacterium]